MGLGEFVNHLLVLLCKRKINLSLHKQSAWHNLFYKLKKMPRVIGKPDFLNEMRFDWDGPYPKSQELSRYLDALYWTGCVSSNSPLFQEYRLGEALAALWSGRFDELDKESKEFLQTAFELALEEFGRETR